MAARRRERQHKKTYEFIFKPKNDGEVQAAWLTRVLNENQPDHYIVLPRQGVMLEYLDEATDE